jgi:hypothetical protein
MTAEVIAFPVRAGNGAREALIEIGRNCPFHLEHDVAPFWADDLLIELFSRGFKVVPLEDGDCK